MSESASDAGALREERNPQRIGVGDPHRPAIGWTEIGIAAVAYVVLSVLLIVAVAQAFGGDIPALGAVIAAGVGAVIAAGVGALLAVVIAISVRVRSAAALGLRRVSGQWVLYGIAAGLAVWW